MSELESKLMTLPEAIAARDDLAARAAMGECVSAAQWKAATEAVNDAEADQARVAAIEVHGRKQRELAEIASLCNAVTDIEQRRTNAIADDLAAAAELDIAVRAAQDAAERRAATACRVVEIDQEAWTHNEALSHSATRNIALAALAPPERPKARTLAAQKIGAPTPLRVALTREQSGFRPEFNGRYEAVVMQSAEAIARAAWGRPAG
jgi:hypothetical protein